MNILTALLLFSLASTTLVGLAVLVIMFARHCGRTVELVSEEPGQPGEVTENPYQPSRLRVTVKRYCRPYSPGELKIVVGGSVFVGLGFLAAIFIGWLTGG